MASIPAFGAYNPGPDFYKFTRINALQIFGQFILTYFFVAINLVQPAVSVEISPPALHCGKTAKYAEKIVCEDSDLMRLEKIMRSNYIAMMSSEIGTGATNELMKKQKLWIASKNKCKDRKCIEDAYKIRIKEICSYPVLSGVYPECTIID